MINTLICVKQLKAVE